MSYCWVHTILVPEGMYYSGFMADPELLYQPVGALQIENVKCQN